MRVRTDEESAVGTLSAPMSPAKGPSVSPMPPSQESVPIVPSPPRRGPLPALCGVRGAGARFGGTPLSGTLDPRALPFADLPDVMCLSPDGIAGCAHVNYGPRTARSDRSSDDSP